MSYEHSSPSGAATPVQSPQSSRSGSVWPKASSTHADSHQTQQNGRTFSSRLIRPQNLLQDDDLLEELMTLVNEAYKGTHLKLEADLGVAPHSIFDQVRLRGRTQLVEELSNDSYLALMFDETADHAHVQSEESDATQSQQNDAEVQPAAIQTAAHPKLVAVASLKRWKGTVAQRHWRAIREAGKTIPSSSSSTQYQTAHDTSLDPDPSTYWDWEVATCSSANDPKYRGMGLISQLNSLLLDKLKQKRDAESTSRKLPIRLWVSALGGSINKDYWKKRGYAVQGDVDVIPPLVWGNRKDIEVWTLSKVVE